MGWRRHVRVLCLQEGLLSSPALSALHAFSCVYIGTGVLSAFVSFHFASAQVGCALVPSSTCCFQTLSYCMLVSPPFVLLVLLFCPGSHPMPAPRLPNTSCLWYFYCSWPVSGQLSSLAVCSRLSSCVLEALVKTQVSRFQPSAEMN